MAHYILSNDISIDTEPGKIKFNLPNSEYIKIDASLFLQMVPKINQKFGTIILNTDVVEYEANELTATVARRTSNAMPILIFKREEDTFELTYGDWIEVMHSIPSIRKNIQKSDWNE